VLVPSIGNTWHFRKTARAEGGRRDGKEGEGGGGWTNFIAKFDRYTSIREALVKTQTKTSSDVVSFLHFIYGISMHLIQNISFHQNSYFIVPKKK
jgi:hypothetical protein